MKRFIAYATLPVLAVGVLGVGIASASGFGFGMNLAPDEVAARHQAMFQSQAALLGLSVDAVKSGWAEGKSVAQIAEANGITKEQLQQKLKDARMAQLKSHVQALVNKGIITQAQANTRLKFVESHSRGGPQVGGMGKGFGFGGR